MTSERRHRVSVVCEGAMVPGWTEYEISSSMIEAADAFSLRRPFDPKSWEALPRDGRVRVFIDDAPIVDGFIDDRVKRSKEGTIEITGRDRAGRLVQESAPRINYQGLELSEAIRRLADPWFTKVTLSDARNRKLRMGKSRRIPAGNEPIIVRRSSTGGGRVQPGQSRWQVIEELASQAGLIVWSAADARELFVGRPNQNQAPSFHILKASKAVSGAESTCVDLSWTESNGDRYSLIACVGTGGGTENDFGLAVSSRRAVVYDSQEADRALAAGTGRDFRYPKRLLMPEKNFDSKDDAARVAAQEQARRDFRRTMITAEMPYHGQWIAGTATLFAPNTVAMVTDEDFSPVREEDGMIFACTYRRNRTDGETTLVEMVPAGTEIVL